MKVSVAQSCLTLCLPTDGSLPGFSVHGVLQAKYWRGFPFPSPGDLPDPGIEPGSPALQADALPSEPPGEPTAGMGGHIWGWIFRVLGGVGSQGWGTASKAGFIDMGQS